MWSIVLAWRNTKIKQVSFLLSITIWWLKQYLTRALLKFLRREWGKGLLMMELHHYHLIKTSGTGQRNIKNATLWKRTSPKSKVFSKSTLTKPKIKIWKDAHFGVLDLPNLKGLRNAGIPTDWPSESIKISLQNFEMSI